MLRSSPLGNWDIYGAQGLHERDLANMTSETHSCTIQLRNNWRLLLRASNKWSSLQADLKEKAEVLWIFVLLFEVMISYYEEAVVFSLIEGTCHEFEPGRICQDDEFTSLSLGGVEDSSFDSVCRDI